MATLFWIGGGVGVVVALAYWLLVITEGVFLGRDLVIWLYDITAHKYEGIKEYGPHDEVPLVVEPVLALSMFRRPHVLDVATGTGRVPRFLLADERFEGQVTALDASAKMLKIATELMPTSTNVVPYSERQRLNWLHAQAYPLPFSNRSFDGITCLESLEFMPSDTAALAEMVRVLRVGGFLMITRRRQWEGWLFLHRYRSPAKITQILTDLGLEHIQVSPWQDNYALVTARKPLTERKPT